MKKFYSVLQDSRRIVAVSCARANTGSAVDRRIRSTVTRRIPAAGYQSPKLDEKNGLAISSRSGRRTLTPHSSTR